MGTPGWGAGSSLGDGNCLSIPTRTWLFLTHKPALSSNQAPGVVGGTPSPSPPPVGMCTPALAAPWAALLWVHHCSSWAVHTSALHPISFSAKKINKIERFSAGRKAMQRHGLVSFASLQGLPSTAWERSGVGSAWALLLHPGCIHLCTLGSEQQQN